MHEFILSVINICFSFFIGLLHLYDNKHVFASQSSENDII